ncbi:MAG: rhodanese-like domain-containing protein [Peptostreptococcaceae bacterium]|nr:rhodanese-like domain-containing protein [Peptostreptococcaceae bacterium]
MKKKLLIVLLSLTVAMVFIGCGDDAAVTEDVTEDEITEEVVEEEAIVGYTDVTPEEAMELIASTPELIIIDVSPAYADGHLPGAINYPVGDGSFDEALPDFDMSKTYLIYCHGDDPSILASEKLIEAEFMYVYRLEGNYAAWVDAGYDVEL